MVIRPLHPLSELLARTARRAPDGECGMSTEAIERLEMKIAYLERRQTTS